MKTKKCSHCKEEKELILFKKDNRNKDGYTSICLNCNNKLIKEDYKENKEKYYNRKKKYLSTNKGKTKNNLDCKKYSTTEKGKISTLKRKITRRKNINKIIETYTYKEWIKLRNSTNGICPNCKKQVGIDNLTLDHIYPISKAETNREYTIKDIQPLCLSCNSRKKDKKEIPKICYFYFENEKMSFLRYMSIKSFVFYNPDFKVVLITKQNKKKLSKKIYEEEQDYTYYNGDCYWNKVKELDVEIKYLEIDYPEIAKLNLEPQQNSDILTWYILGFNGGFVSDTDIIFINKLDYNKYKDIDVSIFSYNNNFAVGFLFGYPNKIYQHLYQIATSAEKMDYQSIGGFLFRNYILAYGNLHPNLNINFINTDLVYPFVHKYEWKEQLEKPFEENTIYKLHNYTCGIHYYAGWITSQKYNNLLTQENYKEHINTITYYIDKVLK